MADAVAYCGAPPLPGELAGRINADPLLIGALVAVAAAHWVACRRARRSTALAMAGWAVTATALLSPLCALSVALFSARVAQHMILLLVAAPLIALGLPASRRADGRALMAAAAAFFVTLWFWHMPIPYAATFRSASVYWAMHLTLFGSGLWLWRGLLRHGPERTGAVLAVGTVTSLHMGLLGALLTLSSHAWFAPHYFTSQAWGLSPLTDQQLGGVLMWVPGCLFFLWAGLRSATLMLRHLEAAGA